MQMSPVVVLRKRIMNILRFSGIFPVCVLIACSGTAVPPRHFSSPQQALSELDRVVASKSLDEARKLLGSDGGYLLDSGESALDEKRAKRFARLFNERHELELGADGAYHIVLGEKRWPFAVPLVARDGGWIFDADAGRDEVLARRIGENEFAALDTARVVYLAQREYASKDWDGDGVFRYAGRVVSSPGKRDGLYWSAEQNSDELSPLGPVIVQEALESYVGKVSDKPVSFRGYYYSMKYSAESGNTSGDSLSKPGHYWLMATPTRWGESAIMTFASNERGWIYQKDLGEDFDSTELGSLDVDDTWTRVE